MTTRYPGVLTAMKNKLALLTFAAVLILSPLLASASVNIDSCSVLNTPGETYIMNASIIDYSGDWCCMWIQNSSITLDCQGHTIDADDSDVMEVGVIASDAEETNVITNVTVKNCIVSDAVYIGGIQLVMVNSSLVENVTVENSDVGIFLQESELNTIANSTINNCGLGLALYGLDEWYAANNSIFNNLFNNTVNVDVVFPSSYNLFNTTKRISTRVYSSGNQIGGNYWTNSTGGGYSDTCADVNKNGFCDSPLDLVTMASCTAGVDCGNNTDYLPMSSKYDNTVSVKSPDNDDTWAFSQNVSESELFNLTVSSTGSDNSDVNFSIPYLDGNFTLIAQNKTLNSSDGNVKALMNITSNASLAEGTYIFNITWAQTETGNAGNITITITISMGGVGDVKIVEPSWAVAKSSGGTETRNFTLENKGNYNLSGCNMSFSSSLGASTSFNDTAFNITTAANATIQMTVSGGSAGTDNSAFVFITCQATSGGGTDSDVLYGSISIVADAVISGGGGGHATPSTTAGDFSVFPSERIVGVGLPMSPIKPDFTLNVYNGNATQSFYLELSEEILGFCEVKEFIEAPLPPGGYGKFVFECLAPNGTIEGQILVKTAGPYEQAIPITLSGGDSFWIQLTAFFYQLMSNPLEAMFFTFNIYGWLIQAWIIVLLTILLLLLAFKVE